MKAIRIALLIASTLCVVHLGLTKEQDEGAKKQLDKAMTYYSQAQFEKAIGILLPLSKDRKLEKGARKEVLLNLGRAYVAKGLKDKAKSAIAQLLALEPPLVEPDPDAESPVLMKVYYDARKEKTGSSVVERLDPGMKTIAVLDFKNRSLDDREKYDPLEKGLADLMIGQLHRATQLKVVERERIQWILDEIALENDPGKFDANSAVRIGKQLGVHVILLGSFMKVKEEMWLGARLVKVETGEILQTEEVKGDADEFFDLAEKMSGKVAKGINVTLGEAEGAGKAETKSLDAMLSYSEGLVELERGHYKLAYEKFMAALQQDPSYARARMKAESIKPLVG